VYDPEGEAVTVPPPEVNYPDGGRNPFFANDFYIDSITMETLPQGKGAGAAHVNSTLKFTVVEPNGITLLDRLYDAVKNTVPVDASGKVNYGSVDYLMVIRFYGYNQQGQLVYPISGTPDPEGTSDSAASIEKFIPFKLKQLNWGVGSKLVSYEWDCAPSGYIIGGYTARGTIPYDVQLTDTTVGGLLGGSAKYATGTAPNDRPGQTTTTTTAATTYSNPTDARLAAGTQTAIAGTTGQAARANEIIAGRKDFAEKAAILGAQGAYRTAQFGENAGGAAFGNPSITRQGITAGATQLLPAGSPAAPTDGTGGTVGTVAEEIGNGPPKLPNTGRPITPGSLRDIQRQAQLARQNAPGTNPSTTTNPANQKIVKD
jgi:hypothetical protein